MREIQFGIGILESSLEWQENEQSHQVNIGNSCNSSGRASKGLKQISINDNARREERIDGIWR